MARVVGFAVLEDERTVHTGGGEDVEQLAEVAGLDGFVARVVADYDGAVGGWCRRGSG
ncbi:hypothetical protein GCM10027575_80370 [Phytohabitans suffuscus]